MASIDKGELDLVEWLGVEQEVQSSWSNDQPRTVTEDELYELAGSRRPGLLGELLRLKFAERHGDVFLLHSPALLAVAMKLEAAGVDLEIGAAAAGTLRKHMARAAEDLVEFFVSHADEGTIDFADVGKLFQELRATGIEGARVIFGREMERELRKLLESGKLAKLPGRARRAAKKKRDLGNVRRSSGVFEHDPHQGAAARQSALHRAIRNLERLRNLLDGETLEIIKAEHRAKMGREPRERFTQPLVLLLGGEQLARRFFGPRNEPGRFAAARGIGAQAHEELVARDAEQERLEGRAALEVRDGLHAGEKRSLHEVVDVAFRSSTQERMQCGCVVTEQLAPGVSVARAPIFEQPRLYCGVVGHLHPLYPWQLQ